MAQVLSRLPKSEDPQLLVGPEGFDDGGVFKISSTVALVQTMDFFPPLVDDPHTFGQIAATNALSDVYAMGGLPLTAMNIVGFPDTELPAEILLDILRGGYAKVSEAGACIVGGHSVRDKEIKYGLAVTGQVHPDRIITNAGARPGDQLVLTKPIGSGILCSAAKGGKMPEEDLAEAIAVMTELNLAGRNAMVEVGAHAATDITGFGLIGHAYEMAASSGVRICLDAGAVPLMAHTREWAERKCLTRTHKTNLAFVGDAFENRGVEEMLANILADAQTSGGLLISVPADRTDRLLALLEEGRCSCAVRVGHVEQAEASAVVVQ